MNEAKITVANVYDAGDWRPSNWTLACVGTFHLIFAATLLTAIPPPLTPPVLNVVDVVTLPDGAATAQARLEDARPVELKQSRPSEELPVPKIALDPRLGPKPSDRRTPPEPEQMQEPVPPIPQAPQVPEPLSSPVPVPVAAPKATTQPVQAPKPIPVPAYSLRLCKRWKITNIFSE